MSGENSQDTFSKDRAELFEALGHPTRIKILELLANSSMGFSDLKKSLNIESSGQLQFHLGKLQGLIKTIEGNYALTDEGREARRIMASKETIHSQAKVNPSVSIFKILTIVLVVVLGLTLFFSYYNNQQQNSAYDKLNQSYSSLNSNFSILNQSFSELSATYSSIFNYNNSYNLNPPVSRLQAIGKFLDFLKEENITLPNGFVVQADLIYLNITQNNGATWLESGPEVTTPVTNYSAVTIGNTTYYYSWYINIPMNITEEYVYAAACFIDASTGEFLIPTSGIF